MYVGGSFHAFPETTLTSPPVFGSSSHKCNPAAPAHETTDMMEPYMRANSMPRTYPSRNLKRAAVPHHAAFHFLSSLPYFPSLLLASYSTPQDRTTTVMEPFLNAVGLRRLLHRPAGKAPKWSADTVNQDVLNASYAVRGPVLDLANKMEQRLKSGETLPFDEMVYCNIGTCTKL